jgi:hypothetical protein
MIFLIKQFLLANWKKVAGILGLILAWLTYFIKEYQLEKARQRAENAEAELTKEKQSHDAQKIIDGAEHKADDIMADAVRDAEKTVVDTDGKHIADELGNVWVRK